MSGETTTRQPRRRIAPWLTAAALLAGCDEPLGPPRAIEPNDRVLGAFGIEPYCAEAPGGQLPAAPVDESQRGQVSTVQFRRAALGRTARALGGNALLAPLQGAELTITTTIVDDRDAVELLLLGKLDFAITGTLLSVRDRQFGLQETLLGVELFALVVAEGSPLRDLRADLARRLLTGAIADRRELGLPGGPVLLGVPADREVRERAAHALIIGDAFATTARLIDGDRGAFDLLLREPTAIAVVHVAALAHATGLRPLAIEGAPATLDAFVRGDYPGGIPLQVVTAGAPREVALRVIESVQNGENLLAPDRMLPRR